MSNHLDFALSIAKYANENILTHFNLTKDVEIKSDDSPVTTIDTNINSYLIAQSAHYFPEFDVLGEEESTDSQTAEFTWVCDPIDGTIPFIIGMPTSTFSLALCQNGIPILGIISHPFTHKYITAELGQGAVDQDKKTISVHSKKLNDPGSITNIDWWQKSEFQFGDVYKNLTDVEKAYIFCPGSTCYSAIMVATGKYTASIFAGTVGKCMDMAAASLLVKEAGGMATDFNGNNQRYDRDINGCLLSNGVVHETVLKYLPKST
jgi:myo-inositol-1(or 4)-monophosphatase